MCSTTLLDIEGLPRSALGYLSGRHPMTLSVGVVIACHTERRWDLLLRSIASALSQSLQPEQVVVVVDHNPELASRLRRELADVLVVDNELEPGASGARNSGVARLDTPLIAFLDDDAAGRPDWLARLVAPFSNPTVVGTGGAVTPRWQTQRPAWFPDEFAWVVGASYIGLPTVETPIRNVWAENMAVRRSVFEQVGGFRAGFGKLGAVSRPEDTDLCLRMSEVDASGQWIYVPDAIADHHVPADRASFRFFVKRCFHEGRGKVELAVFMGSAEKLGSERDYLRHALPAGVRHCIGASVRERKSAPLLTAGAMIAGAGVAGAGAAWEIGIHLFTRALVSRRGDRD